MKRFIALFATILCILCSFSIIVFAKDEAGHNDDLEEIMFANKEFTPLSEVNISRLELAADIAIDQYNGSKIKELSELNQVYSSYNCPIPKDISEINYTHSSKHRRFTHRGWDFVYTERPNNCAGEWQKIWLRRREMLLYVSNQIFRFNDEILPGEKYTQKCNSFCALVYYIHVLGDHENDYKINSSNQSDFEDKMGVGGLCDKAELGDKGLPNNNLNIDIIDEIIRHSDIVFTSKKSKTKLFMFKSKLKRIDNKYKKIVDENGNVTDSEKYAKYIQELKKVLKKDMYELLKEEDFFNTVIEENI